MLNCLIFGDEKICKNYYEFYSKLNVKITVNNCNFKGNYDFAVLVGGGDVNPKFYGKNLPATSVDTCRDEKEFALLDYYCEKKKLVIGTCRGLQIANVFFGGTLSNIDETTVIHRQTDGNDNYHLLFSIARSPFEKALIGTKTVNSAHHQKIDTLASSLVPLATSYDNVIEAVMHENLPIFLTQFHPERPLSFNGATGKNLMSYVIKYYL